MTIIKSQIVSKVNLWGRIKLLFYGWITIDHYTYTNQDGVTVIETKSQVHVGFKPKPEVPTPTGGAQMGINGPGNHPYNK